jgi:hypothetical protein
MIPETKRKISFVLTFFFIFRFQIGQIGSPETTISVTIVFAQLRMKLGFRSIHLSFFPSLNVQLAEMGRHASRDTSRNTVLIIPMPMILM